MNIVTINDKQLEIKEYKGQRVVTFKDIDIVHERMDGTARKRFNDNRERFIESIDFFKVPYDENIERPRSGRSIFETVNNLEGYRGIDYSGYIFVAQDDKTGYWKVGRTKTKKTAEKRLNLARTTELSNYQYFDCVDDLRADKIIQERLSQYRVKNSWYNCELIYIVNIINQAIKEVAETYEPRKYHKGGYHGDITLITETGYLMLVKSFTDDLAWNVQRTLVNAYFKTKSPQYLPTAAGNAAASLISALSKGMRDQGHTPERVAVQIELICRQFGIDIVDDYVKPNQHPQVYLFGND